MGFWEIIGIRKQPIYLTALITTIVKPKNGELLILQIPDASDNELHIIAKALKKALKNDGWTTEEFQRMFMINKEIKIRIIRITRGVKSDK
jgi:hypothetical protein